MIKGKAENSNIQMSLFEINQQLIYFQLHTTNWGCRQSAVPFYLVDK